MGVDGCQLTSAPCWVTPRLHEPHSSPSCVGKDVKCLSFPRSHDPPTNHDRAALGQTSQKGTQPPRPIANDGSASSPQTSSDPRETGSVITCHQILALASLSKLQEYLVKSKWNPVFRNRLNSCEVQLEGARFHFFVSRQKL